MDLFLQKVRQAAERYRICSLCFSSEMSKPWICQNKNRSFLHLIPIEPSLKLSCRLINIFSVFSWSWSNIWLLFFFFELAAKVANWLLQPCQCSHFPDVLSAFLCPDRRKKRCVHELLHYGLLKIESQSVMWSFLQHVMFFYDC